MWVSALLSVLKFTFNKIAKRKLSDKEFLNYIDAYQSKRTSAGKVVKDFEDSIAKARKMMGESVDTSGKSK